MSDYFIGLNRRAMISLGPLNEKRYCAYNCSFCYVRGPFPKNEQLKPKDIVSWLLVHRTKYDIVYISGDTDSFAPAPKKPQGKTRTEEGLELLKHLVTLKVDILFTTRYVFNDKELKELKDIAKSYNENGNLLIGCISVCQLSYPKLEPGRIPSPLERLKQLETWKNIGITTVLTIRPLIKSIDASEYTEILSQGAKYADAVLISDLYVDSNNNIIPRLEKTLSNNLNSFISTIKKKELDFTDSTDEWYKIPHKEAEEAIEEMCTFENLNLPFFVRSADTIEYFIANKRFLLAQTDYKFFHSECLASLTRQSEITNKFCKASEDLWNYDIKGLKEFITTHISSYITIESSGLQFSDNNLKRENGSQSTSEFGEEFRILQEELKILFDKNFPDWRDTEYDVIHSIVSSNLMDLTRKFGSKTAGLDAYVALKRALLTRDKREEARSDWLASLITRTEKILRNLVCNTIYNVGAEPNVERAIVGCIKDFDELNSPYPLAGGYSESTDSYARIADHFSKFMSSKTENTFSLAKSFFKKINPDYNATEFSSREKMCQGLIDLVQVELEGETPIIEDLILKKILHLRGIALHERNFSRFNEPEQSGFTEVVEWSQSRCRLVSQFINSICAEYTLVALSSINLTKNSTHITRKMIPILSAKAQLEIRELNLSLLKKKLYWYAWFLSEATEKFFGGDKVLMLKLNSAYASKKLSEFEDVEEFFNTDLIPKEDPEEEWAPRYKLIQISLLGNYHYASSLISEAFNSGDMSIRELKTWPALEYLRETERFKNTILELESK